MQWKLWLAGFSALSGSFHSHRLPDNILFLQTWEVIIISEHKAVGPCSREVNVQAARMLLGKVHFLLVLPLLSQGLPWRSLSSHLQAAYCFSGSLMCHFLRVYCMDCSRCPKSNTASLLGSPMQILPTHVEC